MASIPGLFRRGGSYYIRIVLPNDHPLRTQYRNGHWVQTLGSCSHREAVLKGTIKRAEVLGGYNQPREAPQRPPAQHTTPVARPRHSLRDVYDRWVTGMPRTADTIAACGRALKLFEEQTGNTDIQLLTKAQGEAFRTWLQTLPTSSKTARDRLIWVRALLRYAAEDLEWLQKNPWDRLDMPFKTTNKRRPWTASELHLFFSQELYTAYKLPKDKKAGADAAYWIPLLGLYAGARLGELAQLRVKDVHESDGIHCLSISDDGEGQSVKTEAGSRIVPIHSELIRLGFLDYVSGVAAKGDGSLWPLLPSREGKPGGYFSQWFGSARKAIGFGKYPDFHCFRHTVRSQLAEKSINEHLIDTLLGHEIVGSTGATVYTHRTQKALRDAIEKIGYPMIALPKLSNTSYIGPWRTPVKAASERISPILPSCTDSQQAFS